MTQFCGDRVECRPRAWRPARSAGGPRKGPARRRVPSAASEGAGQGAKQSAGHRRLQWRWRGRNFRRASRTSHPNALPMRPRSCEKRHAFCHRGALPRCPPRSPGGRRAPRGPRPSAAAPPLPRALRVRPRRCALEGRGRVELRSRRRAGDGRHASALTPGRGGASRQRSLGRRAVWTRAGRLVQFRSRARYGAARGLRERWHGACERGRAAFV